MASAFLASLLLTAGAAEPPFWAMNTANFNIPISTDASQRANIKELELWSSDDEGRTWRKVASVAPERDSFGFLAPRDGLYWFSLVVVFNNGSRDPADYAKAPPTSKILVDTLKPMLRIVSADRVGEEVAVAWEMQEDHPDMDSLKLEYRPADQLTWLPAPLTPSASGQTRFRPGTAGPVSLKLTAQDTAKNVGVANYEVPGAVMAQKQSTPPPIQNPSWEPPSQPAQPVTFERRNPLPPSVPDIRAQFANSSCGMPAPTYSGTSLGSRIVAATPNGSSPIVPLVAQPGLQPTPIPSLKLINTLQLSFNCEVKVVGNSGIGSVELWATVDDGHTWKKINEYTDLKSISAELPSEGIYGFRLVAKSRAGLSKGPPQPNDPPELRVEVDLTPPYAELKEPKSDPNHRDTVSLAWNATDRNLAPNPITLQWAERKAGPWIMIGENLLNTGQHSWQPPKTMPSTVYLRLITRDMAGNQSVAETSEPVLLDTTEPVIILKDVFGKERG